MATGVFRDGLGRRLLAVVAVGGILLLHGFDPVLVVEEPPGRHAPTGHETSCVPLLGAVAVTSPAPLAAVSLAVLDVLIPTATWSPAPAVATLCRWRI